MIMMIIVIMTLTIVTVILMTAMTRIFNRQCPHFLLSFFLCLYFFISFSLFLSLARVFAILWGAGAVEGVKALIQSPPESERVLEAERQYECEKCSRKCKWKEKMSERERERERARESELISILEHVGGIPVIRTVSQCYSGPCGLSVGRETELSVGL